MNDNLWQPSTANPASPDYEPEGTYSDSDMVAATLARLRKLVPELTALVPNIVEFAPFLMRLNVTGIVDLIPEFIYLTSQLEILATAGAFHSDSDSTLDGNDGST
jgi:hypothetical protein